MYDGAMKQFILAAAALAALAFGALAQSAPSTVFVMPMPAGLDQYLAVQISGSRAYRVVTEPGQATLVLTNHIGEDLEHSLKDLAARTAPAPAAKDATADDTFTNPRMQAITRSRGTLFLVDRASRQVVWSTFEDPESSEPKALNRAAQRIIQRMTQETAKASRP